MRKVLPEEVIMAAVPGGPTPPPGPPIPPVGPTTLSINLVLLLVLSADFLGMATLTVVDIEGGGGAGGVVVWLGPPEVAPCMSGSDLRPEGGVTEATAIVCCIKQLESDGRRSTYWDMLVISSRLARPLGPTNEDPGPTDPSPDPGPGGNEW